MDPQSQIVRIPTSVRTPNMDSPADLPLPAWCRTLRLIGTPARCDVPGTTSSCQGQPSTIPATAWKRFQKDTRDDIGRQEEDPISSARECPPGYPQGRSREYFRSTSRSICPRMPRSGHPTHTPKTETICLRISVEKRCIRVGAQQENDEINRRRLLLLFAKPRQEPSFFFPGGRWESRR